MNAADFDAWFEHNIETYDGKVLTILPKGSRVPEIYMCNRAEVSNA